ncbi:MAG: hypothetical protein NTU99_07225 [Pseudanabaena sp. LacPavin_0818_WC45_MAG_42_6]|nr:hypothetical protein [Pseudanabaena sp. LacPavin_0818_WC45_MAG_42_6]
MWDEIAIAISPAIAAKGSLVAASIRQLEYLMGSAIFLLSLIILIV